MKKYIATLTIITFVTLAFIPVLAHAQMPPLPGASDNQDNQSDPYAPSDSNSNAQDNTPAPGVARVSYLKGDVSTQRADNGDWVALTQNSPVSQGDKVATGQNSRAELQLDYADVLRMSNNATANLMTLSRGSIVVQVGQGLVTYSVLRGGEATAEVDTPNASIKPSGQGDYRILVNSDSETQVIVRRGSADVSTPDGSTHVEQGQMITIQGTDSPQYKTESAFARDDWDSWNDDRDRHISGASSWGRTNRYYTGSEDLDDHGTWTEVPDYGPVWTPREVGPDWAPYRDGRWVYEPYYGWTWVSYEPWGWAPYHYGRWFVYGGNWVWWPGPVAVYPAYYPIWSPAYVSFFGWGSGGFGVGFGVGFGHFGWLPCGPGDWYHPWFGRWGGRVTNINIVNVNNYHYGYGPLASNRVRQFSNFHEALNNDRVRGGISSQAGNEFGRGAVSRHQERISADSFRQGSLIGGKMPVTPSRTSFSPSNRVAGASSIHAGSTAPQRFFNSGSRSNSGLANSNGSRSFGNVNNQGARGGQSNLGENRNSGFGGNRNNNVNSSSSVQSSRPGWQKFTPPSGSSNRSGQGFGADNRATQNNSARGGFGSSSNGSTPGNQSGNRGWQHFTPPTSSSRGGSSNSYNSSSRPPLNMRQPIVTPRGGSNSSNPRGNGSNPYGSNPYGSGNSRSYGQPHGYSVPQGGYNAPQGGYNAPRGYNTPQGGYSAPRGYNAPRGGNSAPRGYSAPQGGGSSAPRGGFGGSGGGGFGGSRGNYGSAAPRGSYSAPRGGGSSSGYHGGGNGGGHSSGSGTGHSGHH